MKIWIDFTNTPHVNFFLPLIRYFDKNHKFIFTARDFSETLPLLDKNGINYKLIGFHKGGNRIKKIFGLITRIINLYFQVTKFDISMSIGGQNTTPVSYLRGKPSIVFSDNDISYKYHSYKLGTYFVFPSYFNTKNLEKKYRIKKTQVYTYNGFKEDIYIADYTPDPDFLKQLPFTDFITIRPENLKASYMPLGSKTIVPELFKVFKNENILFLPRYIEERVYAAGCSNIFIPEKPLNGLDVCFYTKVMLTGAGSFAREAALLGTPAVSFFPGEIFLSVDTILQEKGWEFKSRDPDEIYAYAKSSIKRTSQQERSKIVFVEVMKIINGILENTVK